MGDVRAQYRFLAPQLVSAGYRVVRMDVRGHGESSIQWPDYTVAGVGQDILAMLRRMDEGPAILIGNSMAAGAAIWATAEASELVKAMVLLDPAVRGEAGAAMHLLLTVLFARPWGPLAWLAYFKTLFPTRKPTDYAEYSAALQQNLSEPGRLEALYRMMIASKAASEARIKQINAPALVLMGTKDPDFKAPAAEAAWVAGQLNASFEMIEGAGHYPHVEMPEVAGPRIIKFLKTIEPEAAHVEIAHNQSQA
jgi:pimeloyl-ACP methyl ester carboxylesterase